MEVVTGPLLTAEASGCGCHFSFEFNAAFSMTYQGRTGTAGCPGIEIFT